MSIFDIPTTSDDEIMSDIVRRIDNSQTVTDDDLHRITGSTEPQVIMPLKLLTKLLEQTTNEALLKQQNERLKARVAELDQSNNILHRRVAKLLEIIQECDCDDDI